MVEPQGDQQAREERHQVVGGDVEAYHAGCLGPSEKVGHRFPQVGAGSSQDGTEVDIGLGQRVDEVLFRRRLVYQPIEEGPKSGTGIGRRGKSLSFRAEQAEAVVDDGFEQGLFGGEMAIDGARADARPSRQLVERDPQTLGGERLGGDSEYEVPVPPGVGPQPAIGDVRLLSRRRTQTFCNRGVSSGTVQVNGAMSPIVQLWNRRPHGY